MTSRKKKEVNAEGARDRGFEKEYALDEGVNKYVSSARSRYDISSCVPYAELISRTCADMSQ